MDNPAVSCKAAHEPEQRHGGPTLPAATWMGGIQMNLKGWPPVIGLFGLAVLGSVVQNSAPHEHGVWRDALPSLYYLPIVIAAINLGARAAGAVALAAAAFHVIASGLGTGAQWTRLVTEAMLFVCVGVVSGKASEMHEAAATARRPTLEQESDESLERAFPTAGSVRQIPGFGQIVASLVRRFRTPVASIDGALWLLEDARISEAEHTEFVKVIRRESHHLERALDDVLEFTQPRKPRIRPVDISGILDQAIQLTSPGDHKNLILFKKDVPPELPVLNCDPELVTKMLANMAVNAIQATPEGGQLIWTVRADDSRMTITLRDFGRGIPPSVAPRIFDPFFTTRESGLGLGLTVASQIALAHGGNMSLGECADKGTSIAVVLPLNRAVPL
jgi:signal transduction histidine kinase